MERTEVKKMAQLARVEISQKEEKGLENDFQKVLNYVGQIQEVSEFIDASSDTAAGEHRNVTRSDERDPSDDKDGIIKQFPEKQKGYLAVKRILEQ
ncbi:MAG: Asp-tRNA(Asn)/Glu-tRNA(Gln) amidotransferase subunit GatC [Candidatus Paceibacterota bacterium]